MSNDNSIILHNGVVMPKLIQGLPCFLNMIVCLSFLILTHLKSLSI